MSTGTILLPVLAAVLPDGSASNLAPGVVVQKGAAAAPTPYLAKLLFDAAQLEQAMWSFRMPADYVSGPTLKVHYAMTTATTGNVVLIGRLAAVSDGDAQDVDAKAFAAANTTAGIPVPGTAGFLDEVGISLGNNDALTANDLVVVYLARDGASGSDTATGDLEVLAVTLEYTGV